MSQIIEKLASDHSSDEQSHIRHGRETCRKQNMFMNTDFILNINTVLGMYLYLIFNI